MNNILKESKKSLEDMFEYIDRDLDGQFDLIDLEKALNKLGGFNEFDKNSLNKIFQKMSISGGVIVNQKSFLKFMDLKINNLENSKESDFNTLIRRLKVQFHDKFGSNSNTIRQLKYHCEDILGSDRNSLLRVTKRDFLSIMTNMKVNFFAFLIFFVVIF